MADKKDVDYKPVTAAQAVAPYVDKVDVEANELAEQEKVVAAAYVDYDAALKNYESRSDVETLEERRARENGTSFEVADFRRTTDEDSAPTGGVTTVAQTEPKSQEKAKAQADADSK